MRKKWGSPFVAISVVPENIVQGEESALLPGSQHPVQDILCSPLASGITGKKDYPCHLIFPYPALCLTPKSSTRCIQVVLANPLLLKNASVLRYHHYFVNFKIHYFDLFSLHNASALMWTTPSEKNSCFPWKIITNYALWARDMKKYVKDLDNSKRLHYCSNQGYVIAASPESWLMGHLVLMDH